MDVNGVFGSGVVGGDGQLVGGVDRGVDGDVAKGNAGDGGGNGSSDPVGGGTFGHTFDSKGKSGIDGADLDDQPRGSDGSGLAVGGFEDGVKFLGGGGPVGVVGQVGGTASGQAGSGSGDF